MENSKKEANGISVNDMDYLQITSNIKESPRIQKTEYIRQQMLKRRAMEDALMEDLKQEQSVIDSFRDQINDGLIQTEELSRYNQEFRDNMTDQIYLLHGISKDKLEGMQECKNAFRRGYSIVLFLLSTALTILCGALHGFHSEICLLMLAITGIEGAMLAQDNSLDHYPILRLINRVLFPLLCPLMMAMFVCFELGFMPYDFLLPYIAMAGIVILFLSAVPYFIYDPYKGMGKHMRDAKAEIKIVEKVAKKEISKNQRIRIKEEKRDLADSIFLCKQFLLVIILLCKQFQLVTILLCKLFLLYRFLLCRLLLLYCIFLHRYFLFFSSPFCNAFLFCGFLGFLFSNALLLAGFFSLKQPDRRTAACY